MMKFSVSIFVFLLFVSGVAAQSDDRPVRPDEVPKVISRDESVVEKKKPADVRESVPLENKTSNAAIAELTQPRTVSSPYNIKISEAQQKMMLYLDFLTKTENRAESLRSKLFEMIEKENSVKSKIRQIDYNLRPEQIQNIAALSGSLRPENIRNERLKLLQLEKRNLNALVVQIESSRRSLESAIRSADRLVERVRAKFETFVDRALDEPEF